MLESVVLVAYLAVLAVLAAYGAHRVWLLVVYRRPHVAPVAPEPRRWPRVTVQLPLYNERYVAERLLRAVAELDYPRDRLQVQVLDDSTDDTREICDRVAGSLRREGLDIAVVRRRDRVGFKAGALRAGMADAAGELIAIFDADFLPPSGFLLQTVPHLRGEVGMVQARWGHVNLEQSWLTHAEGTLLDGHFVVEHAARARSGRWFNFNGTAGVWRREAIDAAGGWQDDTLTEDLDLSYRAQLAGWRFVYLDGVVAPAELPGTMSAFKSQQHRWAKGAVQTARKLLGVIWRAPVARRVKLEATVHLTANIGYPLVLALSLLMPAAVAARGSMSPGLVIFDLGLFLLASLSIAVFYGVAIRDAGQGAGPGPRWARLPVALALGLGMAVSQTSALVEGLRGPTGVFARTPKAGGSRAPAYGVRVPWLVGIELAFAAYLLGATAWAWTSGHLASVPFLGLFGVGYLLVGGSSVVDALRARAARARRLQASPASAASAGPQVANTSQGGSLHAPVEGSKDQRTA
jgi:cellulose synthase/poly-beta-1,6-N-acetylglucosamine synthase-like glycosyltransferase